MNHQRMLDTAEAVERLGRSEPIGPLTGFTMTQYLDGCGTAGCIAGTVCALMVVDGELYQMPTHRIHHIAGLRLELTDREAEDMFLGKWHPSYRRRQPGYLRSITAAEAAAELRMLVADDLAATRPGSNQG